MQNWWQQRNSKKYIKNLNLSTSHFNDEHRIKKGAKTRKKDIKDFLTENSSHINYHLKRRLIKEKLLKNVCCKCGQKPIWKKKKLVLQLDHIDRNRKNFKIENLRLLCPNCHSQTKTFCRQNKQSYGVMVAQKPLTLLDQVRVLMGLPKF